MPKNNNIYYTYHVINKYSLKLLECLLIGMASISMGCLSRSRVEQCAELGVQSWGENNYCK